jgi:hypothetical protein
VKTETVKNPVTGPASTYLVGTAQREAVVSFLSVAYAEGFLTTDEHSDRATKALEAKTHADLSGAVDSLYSQISREIPGEPDPEPAPKTGTPRKAVRQQPPAVIRAIRCLFIASASAWACLFGLGNTAGGGDGVAFALVLATAILTGLASAITCPDY